MGRHKSRVEEYPENQCGIGLLSVFRVRYYGVNVFLVVSEIQREYIKAYEIETYMKDDEFEGIEYNFLDQCYIGKDPQDRLIVGEEYGNTFDTICQSFRTDFYNNKPCLVIPIQKGSRLYKAAMHNTMGIRPKEGVYAATMVADGSIEQKEKLLKSLYKHNMPLKLSEHLA